MDDANTEAGPSLGTADGTKATPNVSRSGRHRPRVRRTYDKHGLTTLRRSVEAIGGRLLDGRTR